MDGRDYPSACLEISKLHGNHSENEIIARKLNSRFYSEACISTINSHVEL